MLRCQECGDVFREARLKTYDEPSEYWGAQVSEKWTVETCPSCGSDELEQVKPCPSCGEMVRMDESFCDECHKELSEKLDEMQHFFGISYEDLQDMIAEHFGW